MLLIDIRVNDVLALQHDAQLDYYGKRLATCSSDRTVKVFDVVDGETRATPGQTLKGYISSPVALCMLKEVQC